MTTDDWVVISGLATAFGTLILAIATFTSVRVSNRSARASERALLAQIRPVLVSSRLQDLPIKISFQDVHWIKLEGGHAVLDATEDAIYLAIGIRNVGNGIAVLDRWDFYPERSLDRMHEYRDPATFYRTTVDLYIPPGDAGHWLGTFRDQSDPMFAQASAAIRARQPVIIDLLYGDSEGGQHTVSRFNMTPVGENDWLAGVVRHWNLDRDDPR